jgi:hypothetical protein
VQLCLSCGSSAGVAHGHRARVYQILWVRDVRDPTISRRGFNLFKPLRRHFWATPFCRHALSRRDPRRPKHLASKDRRFGSSIPAGTVGTRTNIERQRSSGKKFVEGLWNCTTLVRSYRGGGSTAPPRKRLRRRPIRRSGLGRELKRRNKGGLQAFPSFSKSKPFFAKDFQRKLWRFCGSSRSYKGSERQLAWAVRPLELIREGGRTMLMLEDIAASRWTDCSGPIEVRSFSAPRQRGRCGPHPGAPARVDKDIEPANILSRIRII